MKRASLLLAVVVFVGCQPTTRRIVRGPSTPRAPSCAVSIPAVRITDVTCQGDFSRDELWRAALMKTAETGPEQGSFSFDVVETNEAAGWRALRAKFMTAQEPVGPHTIDALLSPGQLEAARNRATLKACQRAVIIEGTDPATKASCLQYLSAQQQLAQSERHHAEEMGVQRQAVEAQKQSAQAQQQAADALLLQSMQRNRSTIVVVGSSNCRSSLDCGFGEFCKDWSGGRVCMGNGGGGAPCSSSIDCGSGLFCRGGFCAR